MTSDARDKAIGELHAALRVAQGATGTIITQTDAAAVLDRIVTCAAEEAEARAAEKYEKRIRDLEETCAELCEAVLRMTRNPGGAQ